MELHLVDDEPAPVTPAARLLEYGLAWHEAQEIAEAYRVLAVVTWAKTCYTCRSSATVSRAGGRSET